MSKYIFIICLFIKKTLCEESCCTVEVKGTGVYSITPGDVGMVFYLNLESKCKTSFHINTKMIRCIENVAENEEENAAIYLMGGYMGLLKETLTATLIYPNMYLYNRHGTCVIAIYFTDESHVTRSIRTNIKFDTRLVDTKSPPPELKSFISETRKPFKNCETPDLDPLDKCLPVDCMMKYSGCRNYYNDRWKRCQRVPACVSEGLGDEPDVAYIPTSNQCRNLATCITENDIALLEDGSVSNNSNVVSSRGIIVRCNYGYLDNKTGMCECNDQYTSVETDIENYLPGLSIYHMCNVKVDSWNEANLPKLRRTIFWFAILALILTMIILLLTFCLYGLFVYLKSYERTSPFDQFTSEESEDTTGICEAAELRKSRKRVFD